MDPSLWPLLVGLHVSVLFYIQFKHMIYLKLYYYDTFMLHDYKLVALTGCLRIDSNLSQVLELVYCSKMN